MGHLGEARDADVPTGANRDSVKTMSIGPGYR
jgi:hypothetical protein